MDEAIVKTILELVNIRHKRKFPMQDKHYHEYQVEAIMQAWIDILGYLKDKEKYEKPRSNRVDKETPANKTR